MQNLTIKLYPSNWLYNAGILGFLRIIKFAKNEEFAKKMIKQNGEYIEIPLEILEKFPVYYYEYSFKVYLSTFVYEKLHQSLKEKNKEFLIEFLEFIENIKSNENWEKFLENISKNIASLEEKIGNTIDLQKLIKIDFKNKKLEGLRKFWNSFYFNKGVISNPASKDKSPEGFYKKYISPIIKYYKKGINLGSKQLNKRCFFCGNYYPNENISEFTESDFSILNISKDEFKNFYYYHYNGNISPALLKCNLCELIILCAFAGFNYKPFMFKEIEGYNWIFINFPNFEMIWNSNENFNRTIFNIYKEKGKLYFEIFVLKSVIEFIKRKSEWYLQNVYFVELSPPFPSKQKERPKFIYFNFDYPLSILLTKFDKITNLFKGMNFMYEIEENLWVNLEVEVLKRLIFKKPLLPIVLKMMKDFLLDKFKKDLNVIFKIITLEYLYRETSKILKEGGERMEQKIKFKYGILKRIKEAGEKSFDYSEIDKDKRAHIAQRFLSLIRGARKEDFYNELLRLYIVYKKQIPEEIFEILTESDFLTFQEKALAYLTGFISKREETKNE